MRSTDLRCVSILSLLFAGACVDPVDEASVSSEIAASGTLHFVRESKISAIIPTSTNDYEASGVQFHNNQLYIVFDNMTKIGKVAPDLLSGSYTTGGAITNSQYEGITFDDHGTEHFYVSAETSSNQVVQLDSAANATSASPQPTNVTFADTNKGFEGLAWLFRNNNDYLLGLCEGFDCTASHGGAGGRGGILVMAQTSSGWSASSTVLRLPAAVAFKDYSDLALWPNGDGSYKVAVTSQESKALWIGTLSATSWAFVGDGTIYPMPSADYCNVEGVTFLSATRVAMVSDMNDDGPANCNLKDEMVHVFDL